MSIYLLIILDILQLLFVFDSYCKLECDIEIGNKLSAVKILHSNNAECLTFSTVSGMTLKFTGMSLLNIPVSIASTWPPTYVSLFKRWPS